MLERFCLPERYEEIRGDLEEVYQDRLTRMHPFWAGLLYGVEVVFLYRAFVKRRRPSYEHARGFPMWTNYLKIALRNFRRHKGYSLINIFGLGVGIAGCLLILLFVREELSFDRFHEQTDAIYRLVKHTDAGGESSVSVEMPPPLGPALEAGLPEVQHTVRFLRRDGRLISSEIEPSTNSNARFYEDGFLYADSTFFDVFSFSLLQGDPETALTKPYAIVLTKDMAQKYFGEENPLGKTILVQNSDRYEVTGVAQNIPSNSSIQFIFLASFSTLRQLPGEALMLNSEWFVSAYPTYVLLTPKASREIVAHKIPDVLKQHTDLDFIQKADYRLEPLTDVHLFSNAKGSISPGGDIRYVYIFSSIALLILLIGCVNYMNLATAQSAHRAREVGVRKIVGARRSQLAWQFLGESMLLSVTALLVGFVLVQLSLPTFSNLVQRDLNIGDLGDASFWRALLGVALGVGLLSGSYPALLLSRFRPVEVLKGRFGTSSAGAFFRMGLVVFQFTVSVALIAGAIVIQKQLDYVRTKRLGLDQEHVVVMQLKHSSIRRQADTFAEELRKQSQVQHVAVSSAVPTRSSVRFGENIEGRDETVWMSVYGIDTMFLETLDIQLVKGRGFSALFTDASSRTRVGGALVNETAAHALGWEEPLGQRLPFKPNGNEYTVVGVVKDFHFASLREEIEPMLLAPVSDFWSSYISIKLEPGDPAASLSSFEKTWEQFAPDLPFEYFFLDDAFDRLYRAEDRLAGIFNAFTLMAIVVACLGLFGLAAFTAEQRTKEIGIRKVLGATVSAIAMLLSRDFLKLVLVAAALATPIAYIAMNHWLREFAYRVEISWRIFLVAGLAALALSMLTVSYQAIKAALADPVKSLRYE